LGWRRCGRQASGHDPGRVALDLTVMLADGGEAISDLAVLRGQDDLFGNLRGHRSMTAVYPGGQRDNSAWPWCHNLVRIGGTGVSARCRWPATDARPRRGGR
jgi:hypothetical protein